MRKPATFIFVDLKGSTALTERIDQEAMSEIKRRYFTVMAAQIERHGGTIEKYIGDAIMAVFGIPRAHEDDALRAVRAAHGMQQELAGLNEDFQRFYGVELANRTGVNTGEVVANTDPTANQQLATGDTVNVAARLEQAAPANEILIGETTYDLVRAHVEVEEVEPLELKGKSERVPAYRLLRVRDPGEAETSSTGALQRGAARRARGRSWRPSRRAWRARSRSQRCQAVTVVGDPGVGKTRLVRDFTQAQRRRLARVLRGRCLPYGDGITFWPLAEIAREAAGITEDDTPGAAPRSDCRDAVQAAGEDGPAHRRADGGGDGPVRSLVARDRAVLGRATLPRDAGHRATRCSSSSTTCTGRSRPSSASSSTSSRRRRPRRRSSCCCTARHTLLETPPGLGHPDRRPDRRARPADAPRTPRAWSTTCSATRSSTRPPAARVVASADGNPLFVEQLVSMLVDKGLLKRVDGRWRPASEIADLTVPPTIQALLASRLDDLSREERAVVEPASVIGVTFFEPAVEEMVAERGPAVGARPA